MTQTANSIALLVLIAIDMWGALNGVILIGHLRKKRKMAYTVEAVFESTLMMTLNAVCWTLILAEAFVFPSTTPPDQSPWQRAFNMVLFLGASVGITFALHRLRVLMMTPREPYQGA